MKQDAVLAKNSWQIALQHYTRVSKDIDDKYLIFCQLIKKIQQHGFDKILHAETSHEMLIISTQHRYDAAVDKLRIELQEATVCFEYFSTKNNYNKPEVKECDITNYFEVLQELITLLLDSSNM